MIDIHFPSRRAASSGSKATDKTLTENLFEHHGTAKGAKGAKGADIPFEPLLLQVYRNELPRAPWMPSPEDESFGNRELAQDNSDAVFADHSDLEMLGPRLPDRRFVVPRPNNPAAVFQREINALAAFIVSLDHVGTNQPEWPRVQADGFVEDHVLNQFWTSLQRIEQSPHVPYGAANNPFRTVEHHLEYAMERWQEYEASFARISRVYSSLPQELVGDPDRDVLAYGLLYVKLQAIFSCWVADADVQIRAGGREWLLVRNR